MTSSVKFISAEVEGVLVKAEMSGSDIVNIVSDFRGRTTASIQKYHRQFKLPSYKLEIYNPDLGLIFSDFLSSKQACLSRFWEELRHAARTLAAQIDTAQPPADLFADGADSPTRGDFELNNYEYDKANW